MTDHRRLPRTAISALTAHLLGFALSPANPALAQAQPAQEEHKITLRAVMQELGAEYLRAANALLTEDLNALERSAKAIQGHPLPDEIVLAIRNKLGRKFHGFERVDEQSHRAAADLAKRASAKDVGGSLKAFNRLTDGCVRCHTQFRATLRPLSDE